MIMDKNVEFCDAVAVTGASGNTAVVGNVVPLLPSDGDYAASGRPLFFVALVDTEIDSAGEASTLQLHLMSDSTSNLTTSPTTHFSTGAIAEANLVAGALICCVQMPQGKYEKYIGVKRTVGGEEITAGKINAFLTPDPYPWIPMAANTGL